MDLGMHLGMGILYPTAATLAIIAPNTTFVVNRSVLESHLNTNQNSLFNLRRLDRQTRPGKYLIHCISHTYWSDNWMEIQVGLWNNARSQNASCHSHFKQFERMTNITIKRKATFMSGFPWALSDVGLLIYKHNHKYSAHIPSLRLLLRFRSSNADGCGAGSRHAGSFELEWRDEDPVDDAASIASFPFLYARRRGGGESSEPEG